MNEIYCDYEVKTNKVTLQCSKESIPTKVVENLINEVLKQIADETNRKLNRSEFCLNLSIIINIATILLSIIRSVR